MVLSCKIQKDGKRRYQVRVRLRGVDKTRSFRKKAEALRWGASLERDVLLGLESALGQSRCRTFHQMIDRYMREVLPRKAFNTQRQQHQQLTFWRGFLGNVALDKIGPEEISGAKWVLGDRSNGTINQYLATLNTVFTMARKEWRWCEVNPVEAVKRLDKPCGRVRFLSDDERQRLLFFCQLSSCKALFPIVVITLSTAPRKGEIRCVRWADYDHRNHRIYLDETKTGERRSLPLYGQARQLMADLFGARKIGDVHVFQSPFGDWPVDFRRSWERAVSKAKVDNFHFHDLRHSAASYLAMQGATSGQIAEVLGHKTLAMVKRYSHFNTANIDATVERMNRAMF